MKKYLAIFAAILAVVMTSCSNDDIPVEQSITIKVNPAPVVSSLVERVPGELSSVYSGYSLYVDLYIYNEVGLLVGYEIQQFNDYTHVMNSIQNISVGEYTIVAMTHTIRKEDGFTFWKLEGKEKLSTFTITDTGFIGGALKILGLSVQKVSVTSATKDILIDVQCAGAVALVCIDNWNKYSNVEYYGLLGNKKCDAITFAFSGQIDYSIDTSGTFSYYMMRSQWDSQKEGAYSYTFMFPYTNLKMSFFAQTSSGGKYIGSPCSADIEKNHTYCFRYDVANDKTTYEDYTAAMGRGDIDANDTVTDGMLQYDPENLQITIAE